MSIQSPILKTVPNYILISPPLSNFFSKLVEDVKLLESGSKNSDSDDIFKLLLDLEYYVIISKLLNMGVQPLDQKLKINCFKSVDRLGGFSYDLTGNINHDADYVTYSSILAKKIVQSSAPLRTNDLKNILFVISGLGAGGAERQFTNIFNFLKANYKDVNVYGLVINLDSKEGSQFYLTKFTDSAKPFIFSGSSFKTSKNECLGLADYFPKTSRKTNINIVANAIDFYQIDLMVSFLEDTSITCGLVSALLGVPVITRFGSMPNILGRNPTFSQLKSLVIRFSMIESMSHKLIAWGANSRKCLANYQRVINSPSHFVYLPNILDFNISKSIEFKNRELETVARKMPIIISVMRLTEEKRPHIFIEIAKKLSKKNVHFLLIGDGILSNIVEDFITTMSPSNFTWIPNTEFVPYFLKLASIYVMTSRVEGTPNAVMEATLCGLPVVVGNVGGVSEIYRDGHSASVVHDVNNIDQYINKIIHLIDNPCLRSSFVQESQVAIAKRYNGVGFFNAVSLAFERICRLSNDCVQ